jgi:hypothetical protein
MQRPLQPSIDQKCELGGANPSELRSFAVSAFGVGYAIGREMRCLSLSTET